MTRRRLHLFRAAAIAWGVAALLPAQHPAPPGGEAPASSWERRGRALLDVEDPVGAWDAFRHALAEGGGSGTQVGLGRTHLMLGRSELALSCAETALGAAPDDQTATNDGAIAQEAMALCVRALIRSREFHAAVARADAFVERAPETIAELQAAQASALFRVQRIDDAAAGYRRVIAAEPLHPEAHLRLGSGLLPPTTAQVTGGLRRAAQALAAGDRERAIALLQSELALDAGHPIVHRLLGETLFAERTAHSMALGDPAFAALAASMPAPDVRGLPIARFVPGYEQLPLARRRVVDRTAALFGKQLDKLVAVGARHDLLRELERTTDADERSNLRGRRTFDGRVWDDVRGVGGVQAATGIEALDEAATFGFDTLAHEVAHQVHFFALSRLQRVRITSLYGQAVAQGRCLDYYAASNEAEYFGQGVEAFVSLGKRPGGETTHGHTRFELLRVDPALHDFIASIVDADPLTNRDVREGVLEAAVGVALRCGRPDDAVVAAGLLSPGPRHDQLVAAAERAATAARDR